MPDFLHFFGEVALRSSLVLATAFTLLFVMKRASASERHVVLVLGLLMTVLVPVGIFLSPKITWTILVSHQVESSVPTQKMTGYLLSENKNSLPQIFAPAVEAPLSHLDAFTISNGLIALLTGGMLAQVVMLGRAVITWRRIGHRAVKAFLPNDFLEKVQAFAGRRTIPPIFASDQITVPLLSGWLHPAIILPSEAAQWPSKRLLMAVCHELAHFRRGDSLLLPLICLLRMLYWWHPLVWLALVRLRREREKACDDLVLNQNFRATDYADLIVDAARVARGFPWPNGVLAMASTSNVGERIGAILNPTLNRRAASRTTILTSLTTAFAIGWFFVAAQVQAEDQPASADSKATSNSSKSQINLEFHLISIDEKTYLSHRNDIDTAVANCDLVYLVTTVNHLPGTALLSAPTVTTQDGLKANVDILREMPYVSSEDKDQNGKMVSSDFRTRHLGLKIIALPTLTADGRTVDLWFSCHVSSFGGWKAVSPGVKQPIFDTASIVAKILMPKQGGALWVGGPGTTRAYLPDGNGVGEPLATAIAPKRILLLVTAHLLPPEAQTSPAASRDSALNSAANVPTETVFVHVQDGHGLPIQGASFKPESVTADIGSTFLKEDWATKTHPEAWPRQTDVRGDAEIRYPTQLAQSGATSFLMLLVEHPGFAPQEASINLNHILPVILSPAVKITVHMIPPTGELLTRQFCQLEQGVDQPPGVFTWTDGTTPGTKETFVGLGNYQIRPVAFDANHHAYFAPSQFVKVTSIKDMNLDFHLIAASNLHGVLDASVPRPIKNGTVQVTVSEYSPIFGIFPLNWGSTAAVAEDGSFVLQDLPPGRMEVIAFCPGYVSRSPAPTNAVPSDTQAQLLDEDLVQPITIAMEPTGSAKVRVLTPEGKALTNAIVAFHPMESFHAYSTTLGDYIPGEEEFSSGASTPVLWKPDPYQGTTDADGLAVITGLPPGNQRMWVKSDLYDMPVRHPAESGRSTERDLLVGIPSGGIASVGFEMASKVTTTKPAVKFTFVLVDVDEKTYQSKTQAMDEAIRKGELHFFDNPKDGWVVKTADLYLLAGQRGWYSEGSVQSYFNSAHQEMRNGKLWTTLQANSVFLGLNADFSWSKDKLTMDSTWQVTEPASYKPLGEKAMSGAISSGALPEEQFHTVSYVDKAWDMTPGKVHAFWVGKTYGVVRNGTTMSVDDMIKKQRVSHLAVFLTAVSATK